MLHPGRPVGRQGEALQVLVFGSLCISGFDSCEGGSRQVEPWQVVPSSVRAALMQALGIQTLSFTFQKACARTQPGLANSSYTGLGNRDSLAPTPGSASAVVLGLGV